MTLKGTHSTTSSPASEDGAMPSASPAGLKIARYGRDRPRVSRFRAQDKDAEMPINDTCGPLFTASSPSADLQRSLASKLRARTGESGSPLYELTWSDWDMPAGPPICRLRAWAPRTSDSDCSGWPTPRTPAWGAESSRKNGYRLDTVAGWPTTQARDATPRGYQGKRFLDPKRSNDLTDCVALAGWPTPNAPTGGRNLDTAERKGSTYTYPSGKKAQFGLEHAAKIAGWPTPNAMEPEGEDGKDSPAREAMGRQYTNLGRMVHRASGWPTPDAQAMNLDADPDKHMERLERLREKHNNGNGAGLTLGIAAKIAGWHTPTAGDHNRGGYQYDKHDKTKPRLSNLGLMTGWATPQARDWKGGRTSQETRDKNSRPLNEQAHGATFNGSPAQTEGRGQLNPDFTRWLMGYPPGHLSSAPMETP